MKYCSAPSNRCIAASSSVLSTPSDSNSSGTDFVLAAIAPGCRRERGAISLAPIEQHEQPVVFIVGMRGRHHVDAGVGQMAERQAESDVALLLVDRDDTHLSVRDRRKRRQAGSGQKEMTVHTG